MLFFTVFWQFQKQCMIFEKQKPNMPLKSGQWVIYKQKIICYCAFHFTIIHRLREKIKFSYLKRGITWHPSKPLILRMRKRKFRKIVIAWVPQLCQLYTRMATIQEAWLPGLPQYRPKEKKICCFLIEKVTISNLICKYQNRMVGPSSPPLLFWPCSYYSDITIWCFKSYWELLFASWVILYGPNKPTNNVILSRDIRVAFFFLAF